MFELSENMFKRILLVFFLIGFGFSGISGEDETISTYLNETIILTCPIDINNCGELHSVKWFKGNERVAVVSGDGEVANVEGDNSLRMSIDHSPLGPATRINLKKVEVSDEETYLCESTFLDPMETCDSSGAYSIDVKVLVPPSEILVLDEEHRTLTNRSTLGPLREGQILTSICEAKGGRPAPNVGWYRAGKRLQDSVEIDQSYGLFNVKSELKLPLLREEMGSIIECKIETPALPSIVSHQLNIILQVRPTKISLTGYEHHTVQGNDVILNCQVLGANPAANVTWYNGTKALDPKDVTPAKINTEMFLQNDGTFETVSSMRFTASRFENLMSVKCEAENIVMKENLEERLRATLQLEVMFPPVVTLLPENVTAIEYKNVTLFCNYISNPATLTKVEWFKNNEVLNVNQVRFDGANVEQTALIIKNVSREDIGNYTCKLTNSIGPSLPAATDIQVDIYFLPIVELVMTPNYPIIENNQGNVTLHCNVLEGNPSKLIKVKWYLDGILLKELPECFEDNTTSCNFDSNKILLTNVDRVFRGNYSCEGVNLAGLGPRSDENPLVVYYEPGNATLTYEPLIPIKKQNVTFNCATDDYGYPPSTKYRWLRGGKAVATEENATWTIESVGLDSRTNISCYAYNEGGDGESASIQLEVHAPPAFIKKLKPYTGALYSTAFVNLTCRVECVPACSISWFKEDLPINNTNDRYYIKESYLHADPSTGDFESFLSILVFNISAWPDEKLDIFHDSLNYSCVSTENIVNGHNGVRSQTSFAVEYPPENTTAIAQIDIAEGEIPPNVICTSKASPVPKFRWIHDNELVTSDAVMIINQPIHRSDAGIYTCVAFNKHGQLTSDTIMNVTYKPDCKIERKEIEGKDTLICTANGNPNVVDFKWTLKSENETIEQSNSIQRDHQGFFYLENDFSVMRTYRCVANNSIGLGVICEIDVEVINLCCPPTVRPTRVLPWWERWDLTTLIILITSVIAIILAVIIVCCIIICICRKRRRQDKYPVKSSMAEDPLTEPGEYENLPFHGLQSAPNKPLGPADLEDEFEYADVDFRNYGPINYKAASIYAMVKKQKNGALKEVK